MHGSTIESARQLFALGISLIPIKLDGSKRPAIRWKRYQEKRCAEDDLQKWFADDKYGIGIVCGEVSGNLLCVDVDLTPELCQDFDAYLQDRAPDIFKQLLHVRTGADRRHYYAFTQHAFGARQVVGTPKKGAIEFRGDKCFCVAPGSPAVVHVSGKPYELLDGDWADLELSCLSDEDVASLVDLAAQFVGHTKDKRKPVTTGPSATDAFMSSNGELRPGDDYARHVTWDELLTEQVEEPFKLVRVESDGSRCWKRPGGTSDCSVKTDLNGANGDSLMRVFSSNCPYFEADRTYNKFTAYAALHHNNDLHAAAAELRDLGYGDDKDHDDKGDQLEPENDHPGERYDVEDVVLVTRRGSTIPFTPIQWLWDQRIAFGYVTNLVGDGGAGKGHILCDLAARVTVGMDWPDGEKCDSGDVAIISSEDGLSDVILPRCERHGADLGRIITFELESTEGMSIEFSLRKHQQVLSALFEQNPELKLIFFDPLSAFLEGVDANSNAEVRGVLHTLNKLLYAHDVAAIPVGHPGKAERRANARQLGSIAFTNLARCEWQVGVHPDDHNEQDAEKRRLFLQAKNNLGSATGLLFHIDGPRGESVLTWSPEPIYEGAEMLGRKPGTVAKIDQAIELIEKELDKGTPEPSEVEKKARAEGISSTTFRRAREHVGPIVLKKDGKYYWTRTLQKGDETPNLTAQPVQKR